MTRVMPCLMRLLEQELLDETRDVTSKTRWKEAKELIKEDPRYA